MTPRSSVDPLVAALDPTNDHGGRAIPTLWKIIALLSLVLAGAALLVGVWLFSTVNADRAKNIRRSCEEATVRHDNTVRRLDVKLAQAARGVTPARARQIRQSRDFTVSLIDSLSPVQDCDALVRKQVRGR